MLKKYTKGDKNNVISRIDQVGCVTVYIPKSERCMDYLYDGLISLCYNYYVDENDDENDVFLYIPNIDFYNVVLFVNKCCKEKNISNDYILAMMGVIRSFINLKHVSVVFSDEISLKDSYERLVNIDLNIVSKNEIITELTNVCSIDMLEIYLGDIFDQKIIDLINKNFIFNGIISNSYLERDFLIEFEFDEYISYINMFINNNIERLSMLDEDIIDYLRVFPSIIGDVSKPIIKLYTNYKEI